MKSGYKGANIGMIANKIAALRDAAAGTRVDAGLRQLVPDDANSLTQTRTVEQVLKIVYLGGTDKGGFFPNGISS